MSANTMRAAVVVKPGKVEIQEVPIPVPGPGEIRVRLEGCGVCASNLPPFGGREWFTYPMPPGHLGHEGWGVVDEVGEGVDGFACGHRVTILSGAAYAEYDVTSDQNAVLIPPELDGQPVPGEPLGCAMNIFRRSDIHEGQTVAIIGIGFLGSLLTQLVSKAGARVLALAHRPFAQDIAKQMGAAEVIPMDDHWQIIERVKDFTDGVLCDRAIEAVGQQWPLDLAAELTREMGRLIIAGYHQDGMRQVNMQLWNWRGLDVINAHEREMPVYIRGISEAVEAVKTGRMTPQPLFTNRFPLEQLQQALEMARDRPDGFLKGLVMM
jgi:threonine dehydrogenase-like Zn-dependent dehydrogenase